MKIGVEEVVEEELEYAGTIHADVGTKGGAEIFMGGDVVGSDLEEMQDDDEAVTEENEKLVAKDVPGAVGGTANGVGFVAHDPTARVLVGGV